MLYAEDKNIYLADFGVLSTWLPSNGEPEQTAKVFFDTEGDESSLDGFIANGNSIAIEYLATDFIGLGIDEPVTINETNTTYRIRSEPVLIEGGMMKKAWLGEYEE